MRLYHIDVNWLIHVGVYKKLIVFFVFFETATMIPLKKVKIQIKTTTNKHTTRRRRFKEFVFKKLIVRARLFV